MLVVKNFSILKTYFRFENMKFLSMSGKKLAFESIVFFGDVFDILEPVPYHL